MREYKFGKKEKKTYVNNFVLYLYFVSTVWHVLEEKILRERILGRNSYAYFEHLTKKEHHMIIRKKDALKKIYAKK